MYLKAQGGYSPGAVREARFLALNSGIGVFIYQAVGAVLGRPELTAQDHARATEHVVS